MKLRIVADENILQAKEFFADFGEVITVPGRAITPEQVHSADVLLVRSTTPVNQQLLKGSKVSFVGTATIGIDHIDTAYLRAERIGFADAAGCNSRAVVDYVISTIYFLSQQQGFSPLEKTVGIIGVGRIGQQLYKTLNALGIQCLLHDPPLQAQGLLESVALKTLLAEADILSLHVPLNNKGIYSTQHLINADQLKLLKKQAVIINTSRGAVIDNQALLDRLCNRADLTAVLDVWEHEPNINKALLSKATVATPHIAGYSQAGKLKGTKMLYQALCDYLAVLPKTELLQRTATATVPIKLTETVTEAEALELAIKTCCDLEADTAQLKTALANTTSQRQSAAAFDQLRKNYSLRKEFSELEIILPKASYDQFGHRLRAIGFQVKTV